MSNDAKRVYELAHSIDWKNGRCCLSPFPLEINPIAYDADEKNMSYADFIISKEHKFLRNIFSSHELSKTDSLKDLKTFHENFTKFLKVVIFLENALKINEEFDECFNADLLDFCQNNCSNCTDFSEIKDMIANVKVKNRRNDTKMPKCTLQTYTFVYQRLMDFPQGIFDCETVTKLGFFGNVHKIIDVKLHLHHSHITGKIMGYAHDFCNMIVRENQNHFSCIAHNFFGFYMYF